jgi:hypothetical protein
MGLTMTSKYIGARAWPESDAIRQTGEVITITRVLSTYSDSVEVWGARHTLEGELGPLVYRELAPDQIEGVTDGTQEPV